MVSVNLLLGLHAVLAAGSVMRDHGQQQQVMLDTTSHHKTVKDVYQVKKELKQAEIIPTVIDDFLPSLLVEAEWPSKNTYSNLGNTLKPKNLQDQPSITLTSSPPSSSSSSESPTTCFSTNTTYVLALTDPDAPSRDNPKWSEFCHWIATGLTVSSSSSAAADAVTTTTTTTSSCPPVTLSGSFVEDLMPYKPPGPPEKTGKHRYVFLVFVPANGTSEPLDLSKPGDRQHWGFEFEGGRVGVRRWAQENGLVPIAANFIYAQNKKQ